MKHSHIQIRRTYQMLLSLLILGLAGCMSHSGPGNDVVRAIHWTARKPVLADGKIADWERAPEFLTWREATIDKDGFLGQVLTVNLTGPFADGAWSQHAGALMILSKEIPKGQPFTVSFKARSISGPKNLTVLRSWGGATPWETISITDEWKEYSVELTSTFPTDTLSFSLVPKAGRLQSYCKGSFELAQVQLTVGGKLSR